MPPKSSKDSLVLEIQDERIQRLEDTVSQVAIDTALHGQKLDTLDEKLDDMSKAILGKIDDCINPLASALQRHVADDRVVADKVDALELGNAVREASTLPYKKYLVPGLIAAIGAIGALMGERLWTWLSR